MALLDRYQLRLGVALHGSRLRPHIWTIRYLRMLSVVGYHLASIPHAT